MTAYDDLDSPHEMRVDAASVDRTPRWGPGVRFEEYPRDQPKAQMDVSEAAARLAAAFDRG